MEKSNEGSRKKKASGLASIRGVDGIQSLDEFKGDSAMSQQKLAKTFRLLHLQPPLLLPNAWDAGSARVIEHAGARALATTSAGVSWALGRRDGHGLSAPRETADG